MAWRVKAITGPSPVPADQCVVSPGFVQCVGRRRGIDVTVRQHQIELVFVSLYHHGHFLAFRRICLAWLVGDRGVLYTCQRQHPWGHLTLAHEWPPYASTLHPLLTNARTARWMSLFRCLIRKPSHLCIVVATHWASSRTDRLVGVANRRHIRLSDVLASRFTHIGTSADGGIGVVAIRRGGVVGGGICRGRPGRRAVAVRGG